MRMLARRAPVARIAILALVVASTACTPAIEYPPPAQKAALQNGASPLLDRILRMDSPGIKHRIMSDAEPAAPGTPWSWTNQRPRLKLRLEPANWIYRVDFTVPGVVLERVGTVRIAFVVNEQVVGRGQYNKDSRYQFEQLIGSDVIRLADPVVFGMDIDPVYVANDGVKLGVLLHAIGFRTTDSRQ